MKNELILTVCVCILAAIIGIGSASATVTNIDTGENFELIQEAIDDADTKDGHTIVVGPGVYNENVKVDKSLTIKSANENQNDVTIIGRSCSDGVINIIDCSNVNIIGFSVIGAKVPAGITNFYSDGICLLLARNCYIANCSVNRSDCGVCTVLFSFNNTIKHNNIYNNNKEGVYLSKSSNATIVNNNIYDNNKEGVYLSKSSNAVISNNTISGSGPYVFSGIKLYESNNNTVSNNTVTKNGEGIALYKTTDSIITWNNISRNRGDGIYLSEATDSIITGNNVFYNKKDGISVSNSICEIRHNIVCFNGGLGIHAIDSDKSTIDENVCKDNGVPIGTGSITNIDTGEEFKLIQEAIDDSDTKDGHTIVVSPGVYYENVVVNKSLTIKSTNESCDDVTISGKDLNSTIKITGNNVNIIGFSVQGSEEGSLVPGTTNVKIIRSDGIYLDGARNCYIANCSINRSEVGVCISNTFNNTIEHNDIKESASSGIYIDFNSANNSILDNTIHAGHDGIKQYKADGSIIANNNIYDNHEEGVFLSESSNAVIANNNIYDNRGVGAGLYKSSNTVISNNTVSGSSGSGLFSSSYGITLRESNNNTVSNNTVTENGIGIKLYETTDSIITVNNVSYNEKDGIYMFNVTDSTITANNVSYNEKDGIFVSRTTDSTITGNNVSYNKEDGIVVYSSICEVRNNIVCWNGELGIHAIDSDRSVIEDNTCENNGKE